MVELGESVQTLRKQASEVSCTLENDCLPFDDPRWLRPTELSYSEDGTCIGFSDIESNADALREDIIAMVNTLYAHVSETEALLAFRRNFTKGENSSLIALSNALEMGRIVFQNANQSSAVLSTVLSGNTTFLKAKIISEVISNKNGTGPYSTSVRVNAIEQSMAMSCLADTISTNLTALSAMHDSDAPDNVASAAIAALGAFASKPLCHFSSTDAVLMPHDIAPYLHDTLSQALSNENEGFTISSVYAIANARHSSSIDLLANLSDHDSVPVKIGAVRALANIPKVVRTLSHKWICRPELTSNL